LVEHDLAKVGVAGSSPVFRSRERSDCINQDVFFALPLAILTSKTQVKPSFAK